MVRRTLPVVFVTALTMVGCEAGNVLDSPTAPLAGPEAPALGQQAVEAGTPIPGEYVVLFTEAVTNPAAEAQGLIQALGGTLGHVYRFAVLGFSANLPEQAAQALESNPRVAYVGPSRVITVDATQANPTWGLDRIDEQKLPLDQAYTYGHDGTGVNIYILDTGIRVNHNEFGGRVQYAAGGIDGNFVGDGYPNAEDCHGHGTHVAGTAAGAVYGVAKDANVHALRVMNCQGSGSSASLVAGLDWIAGQGPRPAVANMSLSTGLTTDYPINAAVDRAVAAGVSVMAAAGNGFAGFPFNACVSSPVGASGAFGVGASDSNDNEASFSNAGSCVDIIAPGVNITSAWIGSNSATAVLNGTSMATPHAAGVSALYLEAFPGAEPAQVYQAMQANAVTGELTLHLSSQLEGTANRLLNMQFLDGNPGPPPEENGAPDADFTPTACATLTCSFQDESTDDDGTVEAWDWDFGDGGDSDQQNPEHTYAAGGSYEVTLTAFDNDGASHSVTKTVVVTDPTTPSFTVEAVVIKHKGRWGVEISWTGATGPVTINRTDAGTGDAWVVQNLPFPTGSAIDATNYRFKEAFTNDYLVHDGTTAVLFSAGNR